MILDMTCKCGMRTANIWCPFFIDYTYKEGRLVLNEN
jgi:hypothetical protein